MKHLSGLSRISVIICALLFAIQPAGITQEILTATEFYDLVAANYAEVTDYIAQMSWGDETGSMNGTLYYKRPNLIRIDFEEPEDQVLVSNGELFMLYVPEFNVVLQQELRGAPAPAPGALATEEGLVIMRRSFDIAYLEGPELLPLDDDSDIFVTKLRLDAKQVSEGYRQIVLSVTSDGYIRRSVGTKVDWEEVQLDLTELQFNQSIPNSRFDYEPEASASIDENFLFEPEE